MLVAMVHELRQHDAHGGLVLAWGYHARRIVVRGDIDRAGAGQRGDRDQIVEGASLRLADRCSEHLAGQQPNVKLLATDDVLKRPIQRSVRAGRAQVKCGRLETSTELEEGFVGPRVVS